MTDRPPSVSFALKSSSTIGVGSASVLGAESKAVLAIKRPRVLERMMSGGNWLAVRILCCQRI